MKEKHGLQNILLVTGMIGLLVVAVIFDLIIRNLAERNSQLGTLDSTMVWLFPLLQFLFMLAALGLVWLMIAGERYSRWVSAVFLVVGLLLLYINPIMYVNEFPDSWYVIVIYLVPGNMLFQTSGVLAALGLLSLWFWKGSSKQIEQAEVFESEATGHAIIGDTPSQE